ncbi:MAG: hypothetical protein R3E08_07780 [Thiotrichaceae bacterium]
MLEATDRVVDGLPVLVISSVVLTDCPTFAVPTVTVGEGALDEV